MDEDFIKELENVPVVLSTQDEMEVRTVVKGLKVWTSSDYDTAYS